MSPCRCGAGFPGKENRIRIISCFQKKAGVERFPRSPRQRAASLGTVFISLHCGLDRVYHACDMVFQDKKDVRVRGIP